MQELINTIQHSDALELLAKLGDESVDCVLSDIPYGEVNRSDSGLRKLTKGNADTKNFDIEILAAQLARVAQKWVVLFCGFEQVSILKSLWRDLGMVRLLVWQKSNPSPLNCEYIWLSDIECCVVLRKPNAPFNRFYESSVIRHEAGTSKEHPTQKPIGLISYLVESISNKGDLLLDPFVGSGTTALACQNLGRRFIAGDSSLEYVEAARLRLQNADPMQDSILKDGRKQLSLFANLDTPP